MSRKKLFSILSLLFGLFIFFFLIYRHYGVSWDETAYLSYGKYFNQRILNLFTKKIKVDEKLRPSSLHLKGHGIFAITLECALASVVGGCNYTNLHLMKSLLQILTFLFVYLLTLKYIFPNKPIISLLSPILLLFFPRYFGEIFDNTQDTLAVLLSSVTIYFSYKYLFEKRKNTYVKQMLIGLLFGYVLSERLILGYFYFIFLLIAFLKKIKLKEHILIFISMTTSWHFFTPYLLLKPLMGIVDIIKTNSQYAWPLKVLFEGKFYHAKDLPVYYIFKWILITIPPITLLFLFFGIFFLLTKINLKKIYIVLTLFIPFGLIIFFKPVVYDGWRHFLFLTVPMILIAIYGFKFLLTSKRKFIKVISIIIFTANILWMSFVMFKLHPYEYLYFNFFAGGLKGAYGKYETDYAGKTFKEATEWLVKNKIKKDKNYKFFVCGNPDSSTYYFNKNMIQTKNIKKADYFICYTRFNENKIISDDKIIFTVKRENTPLNFIKKL